MPKKQYCERCDLIVGEGCCCPPTGAVPRTRSAAVVPKEWRRFAPDAILISPAGCAHLPGACDHLTESLIKAPNWGWIPDPAPGLWNRLSESAPVIATAGNTDRRATRRCSTCLEAVS
ncbi:hypothetical protein [Streptomyces sp. NPDC056188]|uniref:hypothetical protein n=1 Tax=Streptomyces sp. NPDC056188 TaxID=3345740 RepID=UPI0035DC313A